jgi:serine/threonine protein kinase
MSAAEPGRTLSHYRLIEKIGEGGMGVVWKAEDTVLDRTVAIKVLPADLSRNEKRREMFLKEAKLASSVSDAHIVQVHEFASEGDLDFIVMEYVEGKPLNKIIHGRPLPPDKVVELGSQVARALSRAHRKGLLHRDLKPANILVTPDGDVKVVDFGLAALSERTDSPTGTADPTRSLAEEEGDAEQPRGLVGTLPYMSPEQVRGEKLDARSDIFSLGSSCTR